ELDVVGISEYADVGHHVIGAPRAIAAEARLFQGWNKMLAAGVIALCELLVVARRESERSSASFLERRRGADGQKIVDFAYGFCNSRGRDRPPHPPSRDRIALRQAVDGYGSVAHAVERRDRNMLGIVVQNVLVNLVGDGEDVVLHAQVADQFEFLAAEYLVRGIVWYVQVGRFGSLLDVFS